MCSPDVGVDEEAAEDFEPGIPSTVRSGGVRGDLGFLGDGALKVFASGRVRLDDALVLFGDDFGWRRRFGRVVRFFWF